MESFLSRAALITAVGFAAFTAGDVRGATPQAQHAAIWQYSIPPGQPLGSANGDIEFRVSSGALEQTGANTFKVAARSGGLRRQGQPWEPWIMAYQKGDNHYRSTDRPAHILINIKNTTGAAQSLTFDSVANVKRGTRSISLKASSSSGMPVQFFVDSGPAVVLNNRLVFTPIPPRSSYPVRVIVSGFQWGRVGANPIQSASPITKEFFVER